MRTLLLPTKGISPDRALLTIGSQLLPELSEPTSVSVLWERFSVSRDELPGYSNVTFDWFSLAVTTLFAMGLIDWTDDGRLRCVDVR
ncbi:ABC-three component system middle component 6 [Agromyces bauzanensis]